MSIEFLVVIPIEKMPKGATYVQGEPLPLHCTLMHWFELDGFLAPLDAAEQVEITCAALGKEKVVITAEERALFGPNDDVPVSVLSRSNDLNLLHISLLNGLAEKHAKFKEFRWVGAGYRAHVADAAERSLEVGSTHECDHAALVCRSEDGQRKVLRLYPFGG